LPAGGQRGDNVVSHKLIKLSGSSDSENESESTQHSFTNESLISLMMEERKSPRSNQDGIVSPSVHTTSRNIQENVLKQQTQRRADNAPIDEKAAVSSPLVKVFVSIEYRGYVLHTVEESALYPKIPLFSLIFSSRGPGLERSLRLMQVLIF